MTTSAERHQELLRIKRLDPDVSAGVESRLKRLKELNATARKTRLAHDRYAYLERVYRYAGRWGSSASAKHIARALGASNNDTPDFGWFILRLLKLSSDDDRRLRSKHGAALRFPASRDVAPERVPRFITSHHGLNACAARFRKLQQR
jgi:hypothetical protein